MEKINSKERVILAMAQASMNKPALTGITPEDCYKVYRTRHHIKVILERLVLLRMLLLTQSGRFIITEEGQEALGVETRETKLLEFGGK